MCDINQLWSVEPGDRRRAAASSRTTSSGWRTRPPTTTTRAWRRIADALTTPIAAGEYVYGIAPFRQLLERRSIDIVMIDLLRVGGITQWMKIAGMAEAFNLPVVSHLIPEIHVHLIAAIPNGLTVEYMPWTLAALRGDAGARERQLVVPTKPGLGLAFDKKAIEKYEVR